MQRCARGPRPWRIAARSLCVPRGTARQQEVSHIHARHQQQAIPLPPSRPTAPAAPRLPTPRPERIPTGASPCPAPATPVPFARPPNPAPARILINERAAAARNHHQAKRLLAGARIAWYSAPGESKTHRRRSPGRRKPVVAPQPLCKADRAGESSLSYDARVAPAEAAATKSGSAGQHWRSPAGLPGRKTRPSLGSTPSSGNRRGDRRT